MIYTSHALHSKIDLVQNSANNNRKNNPTRSTFEDGFARGLSHTLPTVEKLENNLRDLMVLLEEVLAATTSPYQSGEEDEIVYCSELDPLLFENGKALLKKMKS